MKEVGKRPKWGRPPVERSQARTERVVTFLTMKERALLAAYADNLGQSISATAHHLICSAMENKLDPRKSFVQSRGHKGSDT